MSSTLYIPPQGLRFRLIGYASQCAIFSRTTQEPYVGHYSVSYGEYPSQWFTLLHDCEGHPGRYAIKSQVTGKVLFSRRQSPQVGHVDGDGEYGDNWFEFEPGSGQYAGYFRLTTPSQSLALRSRSYPDPSFSNYAEKDFYADQLFGFVWEEMKVDKVEYNLDAGQIISSTPVTLGVQVFKNNTYVEQEMYYSIDLSFTGTSTFEYGSGFVPTVGMEFTTAIPSIVEGEFTVAASSTRTWVWGSTNEYTTRYSATFSVKVAPHSSVRVLSVVNRGVLGVPYTMYLSSKSAGVEVQTKGTWRGVSSWDLRQIVTILDSNI